MSKTIIKERPIGTVFEWHGLTLKVVESFGVTGCMRKCCFYDRCNPAFANHPHLHFEGNTKCATWERKDGNNVHYEKVK